VEKQIAEGKFVLEPNVVERQIAEGKFELELVAERQVSEQVWFSLSMGSCDIAH